MILPIPFALAGRGDRVHQVGNGRVEVVASGDQTGGAWWCVRQTAGPGRETTLHVHDAMDEFFYGLAGHASLWLDGRWHALAPGALAAVPRGRPHALGNFGTTPATTLVWGTPAGFERFFADIEDVLKRLNPYHPDQRAEMERIYARYDSRVVAPAPPFDPGA